MGVLFVFLFNFNFYSKDLIYINYAKDVHVVDFDFDGDKDILVSGFDSVFILENISGYYLKRLVGTVNKPYGVYYGDFDNDGDYDIVSTAAHENAIYVFKNNGWWNFLKIYVANISYPKGVWVGDMDEDGMVDIVTGGYPHDIGAPYTNKIVFLKNNGNFTFSLNEVGTIYYPWFIKLFDIDFDGDLDIIVADANYYKPLYFILNNNGSWDFYCPVSLSQENLYGVGLDVYDTSNVLISCTNTSSYSYDLVFYEKDGGVWGYRVIDDDLLKARGVGLGDFDNDGDLDIVVVTDSSKKAFIYENKGFYFEKNLLDTYPTPAYGVECSDIDNDGDIDIIVGTGYSVKLYENLTLDVKEQANKNISQKESVFDVFSINGKYIGKFKINDIGKKIKFSGIYFLLSSKRRDLKKFLIIR